MTSEEKCAQKMFWIRVRKHVDEDWNRVYGFGFISRHIHRCTDFFLPNELWIVIGQKVIINSWLGEIKEIEVLINKAQYAQYLVRAEYQRVLRDSVESTLGEGGHQLLVLETKMTDIANRILKTQTEISGLMNTRTLLLNLFSEYLFFIQFNQPS